MSGKPATTADAGQPGEVRITARAAEAMLQRAREAEVSGWLLRVAVVSGGCDGLSYDLYFVPEPGPEDRVFEGPVRVAVDRASLPLLAGTTIDLTEGRQPTFRFLNPRARKICSCGASFQV